MWKLQVGADQKRQQVSPPRVKDWLKREEIPSLHRNRQPDSSINTIAIKFGWCFCLEKNISMRNWLKQAILFLGITEPFGLMARIWGITVIVLLVSIDFAMPQLMERSDYLEAFYVAGHLVATGHASALYPPSGIQSFAGTPFDIHAHELLKHLDSPAGALAAIYMYSPLNACLFAPLSLLSPLVSLLWWQGISLIALACCAKLLARILDVKASSLFFVSLMFLPVFHTLLIGQLGIVFGLLPITYGYFLLHKGKPFLAGLIWSMLLLKPQFLVVILVFALSLAVARHHQCLIGILGGVILLATLNIICLGPKVALGWLSCMKLAETTYQFPYYLLVGLPSIVVMLLPLSVRLMAKLPVYGAAFALGANAIWQGRKLLLSGLTQDAKFSLLMVLSSSLAPLVVPHFLFYDLSCLLPAGIIAYHLPGEGGLRKKLSVLASVTWLCINAYFLLFFFAKSNWAHPWFLSCMLLVVHGLVSVAILKLGTKH
ncbi:MAG: DUF2029 domain-containing protein [Candidatus Melainabacteria bacterium]|nr:DUF2029 domain-containing protein [Candidatus Melainabacteria bacterium]